MAKQKEISQNINEVIDGLYRLFRQFFKDEAVGGKLLVLGAAVAIALANSSLAASYSQLWETQLRIGLGGFGIELDLRHWINEGLMAIFFLVVGLEIKREMTRGELRNRKIAALPIGAAIGGMAVPALIYLLFNNGTSASGGWGIPMATDIAFAVAVLSLLGRRVPIALKIFLLTLAIADDLGAIVIIALFYTTDVHVGYLFAALGIVGLIGATRRQIARSPTIFMLFGAALWVCLYLCGVHASIAGAIVGILAPLRLGNLLEKVFLPISSFVVVPIFALANAGVVLSLAPLQSHTAVALGIISGLVIGKALGIYLASWVLVRLRIAQLPSGVTWRHIIGIGCLAGIGFTVSIFVADLAFSNQAELIATAKLSILIGSLLSALIGSVLLLQHQTDQR